jgi:hypothetical protein
MLKLLPPPLALILHKQVSRQHSSHEHMEYEMLLEKGSPHLFVYCCVQQSLLAGDPPVKNKQRHISIYVHCNRNTRFDKPIVPLRETKGT